MWFISFLIGYTVSILISKKRIASLRRQISVLNNKIQSGSIAQKSKLRAAIEEKITEFEGYKTNPSYQSDMEQNAVIVTLRELNYLVSVTEFEEFFDEEKKA